MTRITDERLAGLIEYYSSDPEFESEIRTSVAAALRELQQWRSGVDPETGSPIGRLVVMQPWTDETE